MRTMTWGQREGWALRLVREDGLLHILVDEPDGDVSLSCCGESRAFWTAAEPADPIPLGTLCPACVVGLADLCVEGR